MTDLPKTANWRTFRMDQMARAIERERAMTAKMTPGEWIAGCDRDDIDEANGIYAGDVLIATVHDAAEIRSRHNRGRIEGPGNESASDSLDEVDANARLMAASPSMAKALMALLWPNVPSADDLMILLRISGVCIDKQKQIEAMIERLCKAQASALAALKKAGVLE